MTTPDIRFGLKDKVCIVIGAAQGIGRACAERFAAEHGGRLVAFDHIPPDYVLGSGEPVGPAAGGTSGSAPGTAHSSGHGH